MTNHKCQKFKNVKNVKHVIFENDKVLETPEFVKCQKVWLLIFSTIPKEQLITVARYQKH